MIYLDTSAMAKLLWSEVETSALSAFVAERSDQPLVSSELLVVELRRAVMRNGWAAMPRADLLLTRVERVAITRSIVESASRLPDANLRSLDAIHLATALMLRENLTAFVAYDKRLASAAESHRLVVSAPA